MAKTIKTKRIKVTANPVKKVHTHNLETKRPCGMKVHCLRLLPGDDLIPSLMSFAVKHKIEAATVLSCVGSTGTTTLRPAATSKLRVYKGAHEIISFSGTFSRHG